MTMKVPCSSQGNGVPPGVRQAHNHMDKVNTAYARAVVAMEKARNLDPTSAFECGLLLTQQDTSIPQAWLGSQIEKCG